MSVFDNLKTIKYGGITGFKQVLAAETKKVATKQRTGSPTGSKVPYMHNIQMIKQGGLSGYTSVFQRELGKVNITQGKVDAGSILANIGKRYGTEQPDASVWSGWLGGFLGAGAQAVTDFWSLFLGTGADKGEVIGGVTGLEDLGTGVQTVLEDEYGTGNILVNPVDDTATPFEFPDILGGIGKTLLIGAAIIGGLYLLGKYLGRGTSK